MNTTISAHRRDSFALCQTFLELEKMVKNNTYNNFNEYDVVNLVDSYRSRQKFQAGPSFETISATGINAAIIHYAPSENDSAGLNEKELLMLDSGYQYLDGTTDVTRTLCFNQKEQNKEKTSKSCPTPDQKDKFTRVLQGHINIQRSIFKKGTDGDKFDILARENLWKIGEDYAHGTGHGVGYYSIVHEFPVGIGTSYSTKLYPGMLTSIEPGYYKENDFGLRIENVAMVVEDSTYGPDFCTFLPLTLVPYQTKLIDVDLLETSELDYINIYHELVREKLIEEGESQGFTENDEIMKWIIDNTEKIQREEPNNGIERIIFDWKIVLFFISAFYI